MVISVSKRTLFLLAFVTLFVIVALFCAMHAQDINTLLHHSATFLNRRIPTGFLNRRGPVGVFNRHLPVADGVNVFNRH